MTPSKGKAQLKAVFIKGVKTERKAGEIIYWFDTAIHTPDSDGVIRTKPHRITQVFPNRNAVMVVPV